MSRFLFDTNIVLGYVRDAPYCRYLDLNHDPLASANTTAISAVSKGEILSLALQLGWGQPKKEKLKAILDRLPALDINRDLIIERYAEIDAFSQGKMPNLPLGMSARNMGKNDLWIAATASVMNAALVTTDNDFDHLNGTFCDLIKIDQALSEADFPR